MKTKKVWISVRSLSEGEDIEIFDSFDEIYGLFDYTECIEVSEKTYKKLCSGNYYAKRYGETLRAYC